MPKPFDVKLRGLEGMKAALETLRGEAQKRVGRGVELTTGAVFRKARKAMRGVKTGRLYRIKGRLHRASAENEAPAIGTRKFYRSIFKRVTGMKGEVGSHEPEGLWLEFGAMRAGGNLMKRRPWLRPAIRSERRTWRRRMRRALNGATRAARRQAKSRRR